MGRVGSGKNFPDGFGWVSKKRPVCNSASDRESATIPVKYLSQNRETLQSCWA